MLENDTVMLGLTSLRDLYDLGGVVILLLMLLSVVSLAVIIYKTLDISIASRRGRRVAINALDLWETGRRKEALLELSGQRTGLAHVVGVAMQAHHYKQSHALAREELVRIATALLERMRSRLRILELIGSISPLLGLFGTVLGMITAFKGMEAAGSQIDPSVLSGGIWQALLTTGVGLAVAIPSVVAHQWLERRVEVYSHELEDRVTRVFTADLQQSAEGISILSESR